LIATYARRIPRVTWIGRLEGFELGVEFLGFFCVGKEGGRVWRSWCGERQEAEREEGKEEGM